METDEAQTVVDHSYEAFISYSRKDAAIARELQWFLQGFARRLFRSRSMRVCLDEASFGAGELSEEIERKLARSKWLVLIASPESAKSAWVAKEVGLFVGAKGAERVCIVRTGGGLPWLADGEEELGVSADVAQALGDRVPRVIDVARFRGKRRHQLALDREFQSEVASVVATVRGQPKDEIFGEHITALRRRITAVAIGITALLGAVAAAIIINGELGRTKAERDLEAAGHREAKAETARKAAETELEKERTKEAQAAERRERVAAHTARSRALASQHGSEAAAIREALEGVLALEGDDPTTTLYEALVEATAKATESRIVVRSDTGMTAAAFAHGSVVTGGEGGAVWVAPTELGQAHRSLRASGAPVDALVVADERVLVVERSETGDTRTSSAVRGRLYELETGAEVDLAEPFDAVDGIRLGPDATLVAHSGAEIRIWNARDGALVGRYRGAGVVAALTPFPSGHITLVTEAGRVAQLDRSSMTVVRRFKGTSPGPLDIAVAPGGEVAVLARPDYEQEQLHLWRGAASSLGCWEVSARPPTEVALTRDPEERAAALAYHDRQRREGWLVDPRCRAPASLHPPDYSGASITPGGLEASAWAFHADRLLTGYSNGTARLWTMRAVAHLDLEEHTDAVTAVGFSGDGSQAITASKDRTALVWSTRSSRVDHRLAGHRQPVRAAALSSSGALAATASEDGTTRLWTLDAGHDFRVEQPGSPLSDAVFSGDADHLAAVDEAGTVRWWDLGAPTATESIKPSDKARRLAIAPDGSRIVFTTKHGLWSWAPGSGQPTQLVDLPPPALVAFADVERIVVRRTTGESEVRSAADGAMIREIPTARTDDVAAISKDWIIALSSSNPPEVFSVVDAHDPIELDEGDGRGSIGEAILSDLFASALGSPNEGAAAVSGDGARVVVVGQDGVVRLWDIAGEEPRIVVELATGWDVEAVACTRDGGGLAVASRDGAIRVWQQAPALDATIEPGTHRRPHAITYSADGAFLLMADSAGIHRYPVSLDAWRERACLLLATAVPDDEHSRLCES